jgi:hypothetical protein
MMVEPVLVTVEAPRTAKPSAEPSGPADAADGLYKNAANGRIRAIRVKIFQRFMFLRPTTLSSWTRRLFITSRDPPPAVIGVARSAGRQQKLK